MVPEAQIAKEKKQEYVPPAWIDKKIIQALPKDKQKYWANRLQGKSGQGETKIAPKVIKVPQDVTIGFNNQGEMVAKTREMRRRKLPSPARYTKSTHSIRKARNGK